MTGDSGDGDVDLPLHLGQVQVCGGCVCAIGSNPYPSILLPPNDIFI